MQAHPTDAVAKALLFANGLRKNVAAAGRRWTAWPGGAAHLATILACIDRIAADVRTPRAAGDPAADAAVAACISDLRAVLEWTTYQSAALATARALLVARRTRAFVERFDLLDPAATPVAALESADEALVADVRTRNGYLTDLAQRHPHLAFPPPLVSAASLVPRSVPKPGRLALIQRLTKSVPPYTPGANRNLPH
jgi:hypothetical protein